MKNKAIKLVCITVLMFLLNGCSVDIDQYNEVKKPFDIKTYFNGSVIAWGMIQNFSGQVTRRFCVEIQGSWQDNQGLLAETFYFDDGEISYRNWQLVKLADGAYKGTAEDVIDTANGQHAGFAFQFSYNLLLPIDDDVYTVSMDDWMYQLDQYRVMNKTSISKLGINVADVTLFFDKELPQRSCIVNASR